MTNQTALKLKIDLDRVTLNDLIMLEEGGTARSLRDFLARCAMDETGNPIGEQEAKDLIGSLPVNQVKTLALTMAEDIKKGSAISP